MYHLLGARELLRSIVTAAAAAGAAEDAHFHSSAELREALYAALGNQAAPGPLRAAPYQVSSPGQIEKLSNRLPFDRRLDRCGEPTPERSAQAIRGWELLWSSDTGLSRVLDLVIKCYFSTDTERAGSMSEREAIGALWVSPSATWTDYETAEAFLHESTHTFLFIDELVHGHFTAGVNDVRVVSSMLREDREMAAAVHSALVSTELLAWRAKHGVPEEAVAGLHGTSERIASGTNDVLASVLDSTGNRDVLTTRMGMMLEASRKLISQLRHVSTKGPA